MAHPQQGLCWGWVAGNRESDLVAQFPPNAPQNPGLWGQAGPELTWECLGGGRETCLEAPDQTPGQSLKEVTTPRPGGPGQHSCQGLTFFSPLQ